MLGFGTLHDPEHRLLALSRRFLPEIAIHFSHIIIAVSPQTGLVYHQFNGSGNITFFTFGETGSFASGFSLLVY